MTTTIKFSIAASVLLVGLAACAGKGTDAASQADFKHDLQLASSTSMDLAAPKVDPKLLTLENKPNGAPDAATVVKKGAGTRAVKSNSPTVRAAPVEDVAATDDQSEQAEAESTAPVPEPSNEPVAVAPRPTPVVLQAGGSGGDYGTSGSGGGVWGTSGGRGGSVIRGGGVDGDHCEPHGRNGGVRRGGIYIPSGGSTLPRSPFPIIRIR